MESRTAGSLRQALQLACERQPRARRANASSGRTSRSTIPWLGSVESSLVGGLVAPWPSVGVAVKLVVDAGKRSIGRETHVALYAAGLAIAAAIYPAARRRWGSIAQAGELLGVVGHGTASVLATRRPRPRATRPLAAGWASHALFDACTITTTARGFRAGAPALRAGYDLVVCAATRRRQVRLSAQRRGGRGTPGDDPGAGRSRGAELTEGGDISVPLPPGEPAECGEPNERDDETDPEAP
ncbi:MAG: hypothetical protein ACXVHQ_35895 [Solirubrobacteraceae bacterium]